MAGPTTDATGQIVKAQKGGDAANNLASLVQRMSGEIARALPKHITPDRMARIVLTALRTTRDLSRCTPESFLACVMQASQLGLEPNTPLGHAYLIPRKSKYVHPDARECTLIIGYQGFIELARRSGMVANVYAHAVRRGDTFEFEYGLNPTLRHKPAEDDQRESRPITHVYAVAVGRDSADRTFEVLSIAQVEARRTKESRAEDGIWAKHYEAMVVKTGVRALWKWLPKSSEMARAEAIDVAAEMGIQQTRALEPSVADALSRHGLLPEESEVVEPVLDHDPETGEVRNAS